ncbi:MAG TPA: clostripain-related cysteine peptidase [Thermotogota bacterium]|nr:clostripain-related cysteine peptidase [Thermotogota bacterium]HPJ88974.1 clostripain-related cysteine peptidase [Thermotogota bacterium]HPR95888.1 clostripain-related cysteine peptidase [Thermotogota bacterium]
MRKTVLLMTAFILLLTAVFASEEKPYTIMIYMIGSDLESYDGFAESDLYEILDADTGKMNIVIQTGGCYEWFMEGIDTNNQRWEVDGDDLKLVKNLGTLNMGDSQTLFDFIDWTADRYQAENYILLFWDHGAGTIGGFGDDELFDGDGLLLTELTGAITRACGKKHIEFELIGFDACLMGTLETAYLLKDNARYLIASEELEPGCGWWYTGFLEALNTGDDIIRVGKMLIDDFAEMSERDDEGDEVTLSMIDLQKTAAVYNAFDKMTVPMLSDLTSDSAFDRIVLAGKQSETYGDSGGFGGYTDMIDVSDLAYHLKDDYPRLAQAVMKAVHEAVVYNYAGSVKKNSHGLSVYFPCMDKINFDYNNEIYTSFALPGKYTEFIVQYSDKLLELSIEDLWDKEITDYYDYIEVELTDDELSRLAEIYLCVGTYLDDEGEEWLFLGQDLIDDIEESEGITAPIVESWPAINDVFVYLNVVSYDDEHIMYAIPGELNGTTVNLMLLYDDANPDGTITGARKVETDDLFYTSKNLIKIKEGDVFEPYYEYEDNEVTEYISIGEKIRFGKTITVEEAELPDGFYLYGFKFVDFVGNEAYSEFLEVEFY